jgi:hypothetical protein
MSMANGLMVDSAPRMRMIKKRLWDCDINQGGGRLLLFMLEAGAHEFNKFLDSVWKLRPLLTTDGHGL